MAENTNTTEKQKSLTLEQFVRAWFDIKDTNNRITPAPEYFVESSVRAYLEPSNDKNEIERARREYETHDYDKVKSVKAVMDIIKSVSNDPSRAKETKDILQFVERCYTNANVTDSQMFLNKIALFKDSALAYRAAKQLKRSSPNFIHPNQATNESAMARKFSKNLVYAIANNEHARLEDIYHLMDFCDTPEEALKIVNAACIHADKELDEELRKEVPDSREVHVITNQVNSCITAADDAMRGNWAGRDHPLYHNSMDMPQNKRQEYIAQFAQIHDDIAAKYDYEKIITGGDPEFTKHYDETVLMQIADIRSQNEKLEHDTNSANSAYARINAENERLKAKVAELEQQLDMESNKRKSAEKSKKLTEGQLRALIAIAERVRGGIGSKGVNDLQTMLQELSSNLEH